MSNFLQAAAYLADLGYAVFPCAPGGKRPITANGLLDATTDGEQVAAWWTATPDANIGLRTDGLLVIDVDVDGAGNANGWLADDPDKLMQLAAAPFSLTPRGGRHYWFRQPGLGGMRNTAGKIAPNVDSRSDGGYVVVPPSVRSDGQAYRWAGELIECGPDKLPQPPFWLLKLVCESSGTKAPSERKGSAAASNRIPEGQRNAALTSLAGVMRRVGMSADEILAALRKANQDRCVPSLDDAEVETIARSVTSYPPNAAATAKAEHHAEQIAAEEDESEYFTEDPGAIPVELLRVPGFVSQVIDHCLATAPHPNQALAFCGALSLQAFLAARKVRDFTDNRPNLYLLALANSGTGKDWPRKLNTQIVNAIGLGDCLGDAFSSAEGLQDALYVTPSMLFQTDEIDGLLQAINRGKDTRYELILDFLLKCFTTSNSVMVMRKKAGQERAATINQPSLTLFGTAIPKHYYASLSEKMITKGFFSRTLVVEAGRRSDGQDAKIAPIPDSIMAEAKAWAEYWPGGGNLERVNPTPAIVETADDALALLTENRAACTGEHRKAEDVNDTIGMSIWTRADEQTRKLALLYAISERRQSPLISVPAVEWAIRFVSHQTRRMVYMAKSHVSDNPFHDLCLKVKQRLGKAPGHCLPHWRLLRAMHVDSQTLHKVVSTLREQGDVGITEEPTTGRPATTYRLLRV